MKTNSQLNTPLAIIVVIIASFTSYFLSIFMEKSIHETLTNLSITIISSIILISIAFYFMKSEYKKLEKMAEKAEGNLSVFVNDVEIAEISKKMFLKIQMDAIFDPRTTYGFLVDAVKFTSYTIVQFLKMISMVIAIFFAFYLFKTEEALFLFDNLKTFKEHDSFTDSIIALMIFVFFLELLIKLIKSFDDNAYSKTVFNTLRQQIKSPTLGEYKIVDASYKSAVLHQNKK